MRADFGLNSGRHSQLQNLRKERLNYLDATILSTINLEDFMPFEVDDEMILEDAVIPQPTDALSLTTGFIIHSRVFWAALTSPSPRDSSAPRRDPCMCVRSAEPKLQIEYLRDRLHDLKYIIDGMPPQLRQWAAEDNWDTLNGSSLEHQSIIKAQFESMRANIHVTHLWLQSIILDQLDALMTSEPSISTLPSSLPDPKAVWAEREDIARQLLHLLHSIPEIHLEPNGHHLVCSLKSGLTKEIR